MIPLHRMSSRPILPYAGIRFGCRRGRSLLPIRQIAAIAALIAAGPSAFLLSASASAQEDETKTDRGSTLDTNTLGISSTPDAESSSFLGQGTSITLGVGPEIAPAYDGAKKFKVSPFPYLDVRGLFDDRVFLSTTRGLGVNVLDLGPLKAGLSVSYNTGRISSDSPRLRGLSNLNGGPVAAGFITYELEPFSFELKLENTFGPNPGAEASFGMSYALTPIPRLHLSIGPQVTWADRRYDKSNFGVSPSEAALATAEGNPMQAYSPGSGLKGVGFSATGVYQLDERWGLAGHLGLSDLVGSAAKNSPLTQRRFQPSFAFGGLYRF